MDEVGGQMRQFGDVAADECAVRVKPAGGLDNVDGTPAGIAGGGLPVAFVQRGQNRFAVWRTKRCRVRTADAGRHTKILPSGNAERDAASRSISGCAWRHR